MALPSIPSIAELKTRIQADIQGKIGQTIPVLPKSFVANLSSSLASNFFLAYQAILWVYKQIFPQSAEIFSLRLLGIIVGISPTPAVYAEITADIPGTGSQVDKGELFKYKSTGVTYKVTAATAISGGVASNVPLKALTAGDIGNIADDEVLDIVQTNLNLTGTATVTGTTVDGADEESDESFANRVLLRYQTRYVTGSPGGYALNILETPHVIWCGVTAHETLHTDVLAYIKVDNQTDGIPTTAQLDQAKLYAQYVNGDSSNKLYYRVVNDILNMNAITRKLFDVEVFITTSDGQIQAKVQESLDNYADSLAPYYEGISLSRNNVMTSAEATTEANSAAKLEGEQVTQCTITDVDTGIAIAVNGYTFWGGEFCKFRNVTFTVVS